jgi:hypothetical protein
MSSRRLPNNDLESVFISMGMEARWRNGGGERSCRDGQHDDKVFIVYYTPAKKSIEDYVTSMTHSISSANAAGFLADSTTIDSLRGSRQGGPGGNPRSLQQTCDKGRCMCRPFSMFDVPGTGTKDTLTLIVFRCARKNQRFFP